MRGGSVCRLVALGFSCTVGAVQAQALMTPESQAVACMTPPPEQRPRIVYPTEMFEHREGGTVTVEMDFVAPDKPPRYSLEREFGATGRAMASAVHEHVMALRVPCLTAPVQLKQDFVFVPNDGRKVTWTRPVETVSPVKDPVWACLTPPPKHAVDFDERMWGGLSRSTVLLELRFVAATQPPQVRVLAPSPASRLTAEAVNRAQEQFLPCHDGKERTVSQRWIFNRTSPSAKTVLKHAGLSTFLGSVRNLESLQVYYDFRTMGCPFDVQLELWQPHLRNVVGEVGTPNPARRPFLDWLAGLALDIKPRDLTAVLGETMTIAVPCGTLDL